MGPAFVILFWLILAGIYGCIFLGFVGLWFWGRKKNIVSLKWFGKIAAIGMVSIAIFLVGFLAWGFVRSTNPSWVFKQTFNTSPPTSVSKIQSSYYWFGDTGCAYLRFQTSPEEFEKLVSTNLVKKTAEQMERETPGESDVDLPKWWDYQIQPDWIYYLDKNSEKGFANEAEYFAYNPKTQIAYYHFIGID